MNSVPSIAIPFMIVYEDSDEYTFSSSMMIKAEKVIVTMFANESMKKAIDAIIIHAP